MDAELTTPEMSSDKEREKGISSLLIAHNHCGHIYIQTKMNKSIYPITFFPFLKIMLLC